MSASRSVSEGAPPSKPFTREGEVDANDQASKAEKSEEIEPQHEASPADPVSIGDSSAPRRVTAEMFNQNRVGSLNRRKGLEAARKSSAEIASSRKAEAISRRVHHVIKQYDEDQEDYSAQIAMNVQQIAGDVQQASRDVRWIRNMSIFITSVVVVAVVLTIVVLVVNTVLWVKDVNATAAMAKRQLGST